MIIKPLHPQFAAEIIGADLTAPITPEFVDTIEGAMAEYAVCAIRNASTVDDDHIRFSRAFGPLELPISISKRGIAPQLYDVTNLDANGDIVPVPAEQNVGLGFENFHTDSSFNVLPTKWSLLLGHIVPPEGAETQFIDTRIVYDELEEGMKAKIADLVAVHDFWGGRERLGMTGVSDEMRARYPSVRQPLVRTSANGRKALYIGGHTIGIVGWPDDEALALLDELFDFATQDRFIYSHRWQQADLLVWDNRCTLHRGTAYDRNRYKRDCRRTTINEYGEEQTGLAALQAAA